MQFQFDERFEKHYVAHLLRDPSFYAQVNSDIKADTFNSPYAKKVAQLVLDFGQEHQAPPGELVLTELDKLVKLSGQTEKDVQPLRTYLKELLHLDLKNRSYLLKEHETYVRYRRINNVIPLVYSAVKSGNLDEADNHLKSLTRSSSKNAKKGSFFELDPKNRIDRRQEEEGERFYLGIPELDNVIQGLKRRQIGMFLSQRSSAGKGHPHGTKILTPYGYMDIEDLRAGDLVVGSNGKPTKILETFDRGELQTYRVSFSDGSSVLVDGDHLWKVRSWRKTSDPDAWKVLDTKTLLANHREKNNTGKPKWQIPLCDPVEFEPEGELPLDPYLLGVLIGDGSLRDRRVQIIPGNELVPQEVEKTLPSGSFLKKDKLYVGRPETSQSWTLVGNGEINPVCRALSSMGLMDKRSWEKFIPPEYLLASPQDRLSLLQGLMDTDGEVARWTSGKKSRARSYVFSTSSEELANQTAFLIESLGGVARRSVKKEPKFSYKGETRIGRPSHLISFCLPPNLLASRTKAHLIPPGRARYLVRTLVDIQPAEVEPVICLHVEAEDKLYLTEHCIVTHNSAALIHLAKFFVFCGKQVLFLTLEDTKEDVEDKIDMCVSGVDTERLQEGEHIKKAMRRWFGRDGRLYIHEDSPGSKVSQLRNLAEFLKQTENFVPDAVLLDYGDLCGPEDSRLIGDKYATGDQVWQELARWAKEDEVVIWTASQSGRAAMEAVHADMQHAAGSIAKIYHSHLVISINRTSQEQEEGITNLHVVKNKNGHARFTKTIHSDFDRMHFRVTPRD